MLSQSLNLFTSTIFTICTRRHGEQSTNKSSRFIRHKITQDPQRKTIGTFATTKKKKTCQCRKKENLPMQGPQAFASTIPPKSSNIFDSPSLCIVARTCSDPGVTVKSVFAFKPFSRACNDEFTTFCLTSTFSQYDDKNIQISENNE